VVIYSDNAKTFLAGARTLEPLPPDALRALKEHTKTTIEWKFNIPRAPWWGGFYERMMGTIKFHVNTVMFNHIYPTEAHLHTAVVIANRVINSRPLTHVVTDDREGHEAITPAHFLKWDPAAEIGQALDFDLSFLKPESLRINEIRDRRHRQTELHNDLWKRFEQEYIPELRKYHASRVPPTDEVQVGQHVLIQPSEAMQQGKHKKMFWKRGVIKGFLSSRDTRNRRAVVDRFNLDGTTTEFELPVQRLFPLEIVQEADVRRYNMIPKEPKPDDGISKQGVKFLQELTTFMILEGNESKTLELE
jgi:hypothetical protein